jgi:hypothetical protein
VHPTSEGRERRIEEIEEKWGVRRLWTRGGVGGEERRRDEEIEEWEGIKTLEQERGVGRTA